ncbi:Uu.00g080450.m01.CDS01 [Anthostomella pinea]|uniref:Protein disulfide-isomerase n=1 Tax=Anthostomella pinea TaxID=933095 RepID=A0AAI8VL12_9PEZI|nr:Uu.00g080450.m01.CDS01 [Anthostomella pinea]
MHWFPLFALGLSALIASGEAWGHISAEELQSTIQNDVAVVAFVVPGDERTKYLEPEWYQAAAEAQVHIASIDCAASPNACASHGVSSTTTAKLYKNEEPTSTYHGSRRASAILAWINRVQRPPVTEITANSLAAFKAADETVFIAYLSTDGESESASKTAFVQTAAKYAEEFTFGLLATDAAALEAEGVKAPPLVRCYRPLDGDTHDLDGFEDTAALEKFVVEASRPVIGELLPHNHQRFLDRGWPIVYVFARTAAERAALRTSLAALARSHYGSLTIVTADPLDFPSLLSELGLAGEAERETSLSFPAGAVHQLSTGRIYRYPRGRGITARELQGWGFDVWQGRVRPWTPPGVLTPPPEGGDEDRRGGGIAGLGKVGGRIGATRNVRVNIPGVNIRVGGRDEL